jgi:uncharacterized protein involved in exopolysaccharide biosynthesis
MNNINSKNYSEQDAISLRELFFTLIYYKWSIILLTFFITFFITIKIYLMPKYYKSSVTLEVKSESKKGGGFSLGGAGVLLGLDGGTDVSLEKDIALLKTFRTNGEVLETFDSYDVRYFIRNEHYKEREVDENLSIEVSYIKIKEFKDYGMKLVIEPLNELQYKLLKPSLILEKELIGIFEYNKVINTKRCSLNIRKKEIFHTPYILKFSGTKRYIYEKIIKPNLSITLNKNAPFITISLLDTLPKRAEAYLQKLINTYTKQNINDIKEDASININSYNKQLKNIEKRVDLSSKRLEVYKINNSIVQPEAQIAVLVTEFSKVKVQLAQNEYKKELIQTLIDFVQENNDIDAIAPSLIELNDAPTISLIKTIQKQQLELSSYLMKYQSSHPNIINTQSKIDFLQNKILSNLKNFQTTLNSKTTSLNQLLKRYKKQIETVPKREQKLISFSRDYQLNSKMYSYLLQERSTAELKRDKEISHFRVIEKVYTPDGAEKPKKTLMVIVTFISALIFSIFLSFFRNFFNKGKDDKKNK